MSECSLTPPQQLFSYIIARENKYLQRAGDEISFVIDQHIYQQSTTNSNPSKIKT
jgi:hypothetical protein